MREIAIIGAGSWGTALSVMLAKKGYNINLWTFEEDVNTAIKDARENVKYLPGVVIPQNVTPYMKKDKAIGEAKLIILAVPSSFLRGVCSEISNYVHKNSIIVNVAKGFEVNSLLRLSEVIEEEIPQAKAAVLSGPSHAEEVSRDIPTTVVCACTDIKIAHKVQNVFMTPKFRVYTNTDVIGVELGGALKNIIAVAAGVNDGLGFGDNSKAALMTRGITEMTRLGLKMGADCLTFSGLSGIGDLIVTCTSMHSRNRRAGILIGKGKSVNEAMNEIGMAVEGIYACKAAYQLSLKYKVDMPITRELYKIMFEGIDPKKSVIKLMMRSKKHESEELILKINGQ